MKERSMMARLAAEAHLWLARTDRIDPALLVRACDEVLSADERARADRLIPPARRQESVIGHWLVRVCLSRYQPLPPSAWRFERTARGKPEVAAPGDGALRFNLSHSAGLAACIVTRTVPCGVDVERIQRAEQRLARAAELLSPEEARALDALPPSERAEGFFLRWTLKEAYLKARGWGIGVELDTVRFDLGPEGEARPIFAPSIDDDPERWQLGWWRPTASHALAVALGRSGPPLRIRPMDCGLGRAELA
ncbi:MAG: 4'-phosphopantetheinyl transferase superfamily protein [Deltaproteobacteria bacterium]|jgi:4'-phosphopantetheinyl transferase|nr:4'-phosphopantetheinyl transferase superfamily protein [Deltaproteobacteria bacterium]MBW2536368.1 4'-phosphopantetheinyl transferase superfamily protein [Deltaproteobacteria bacterium]